MRQLRFLPLVATTYFMVSGGPYGIEDAVGAAGYARTLVLLALVPFVWSFPTALMVGELASAIPEEGGFYVWVTRAMGPFWGFQEAWLSLAASVFDMALYPALTVSYLAQVSPAFVSGHRELFWRLAVTALCGAWNLWGASTVGRGSLLLSVLLLLPFGVMVALGVGHAVGHWGGAAEMPGSTGGNWQAALLVVLWNYMGWDNASTIAREVSRPQQTYPRAMLATVLLVMTTYVVSVAAAAFGGVPASHFVTGDWVSAARSLAANRAIAGPLSIAVVVGGALTGLAMFNALTLSYARVPAAMAKDGLLPRVLCRHNKSGVPYVAVIACCILWTLVSGFRFERLLELDVLLYGLSLALEFAALIILRLRKPDLPRPYSIPGGIAGVFGVSVPPLALVGWALYAAHDEQITFGIPMPVLLFGVAVAAAGMLVYGVVWLRRKRCPTNAI